MLLKKIRLTSVHQTSHKDSKPAYLFPTDVWRWPKWRGVARGVCTFPSVSFGAIAKNGDAAVRRGGEEKRERGYVFNIIIRTLSQVVAADGMALGE